MWYGSTERQLIMKAVETDGQITNIEISEMFAISKTSLDSMVRTMESLELIQRVRVEPGVYRLEPTEYSVGFLEMTSRKPKAEPEVHLSVLLEAVINEMVVRGELVRTGGPNFTKMPKPEVAPADLPKKKPTVLVVGLLDEQVKKIAAEFGEKVNLRFWKNHNPVKLKKMSEQSDMVFMMSSFLSHSHETTVRDSTDKWKRVFGGLSSLRRELDVFVEK